MTKRWDIAEQLIEWANVLDIASGPFVNEDLRAAAAEIARLRAALRPFTEVQDGEPGLPDEPDDALWLSFEKITYGDLRRARAALSAGDNRD